MIGYIDVGGGMRDVYGAGVLDYCLDNKISFSYYIGVSAGSANIATFLANQRGRTLRFYRDYSLRKEYMSVDNFLRKGSYIDLDYVYSELSNEGSEDPLDYDSIMKQKSKFLVVVTNAKNGKAEYLDFSEVKKNDYSSLKASCCIPIACRARNIGDDEYFDGGISEPIPIRKAFADGCDKVVVLLTRPVEYHKRHIFPPTVFNRLMKDHPAMGPLMDSCIDKYNDDLEYLRELVKEGKALIVAPDNCCGVETLSKNKNAMVKLYEKGYSDGEKIKEFLSKANCNI